MATIAPADSKIGQQIARITNAKRALADYLKDNTDLATENMSINELVEAILALIGQKGAYNIVQNLLDDGNSELVITDAGESSSNNLDAFITREISGVYTNSRVTTIGRAAFQRCVQLTGVILPNVTKIDDSAFRDCSTLKEVSLPKAVDIGVYAFQSSGIEHLSLPSCVSLSGGTFGDTKSLISLTLPLVTRLNYYNTFYGSSIKKLDTSSVEIIGDFAGASNLETLILRSTTICTLTSANGFSDTKIAAGTGYIYVPDNLVDSYKTATNWVTLANQIKPISELEETT
jgi:hypothetical protein